MVRLVIAFWAVSFPDRLNHSCVCEMSPQTELDFKKKAVGKLDSGAVLSSAETLC